MIWNYQQVYLHYKACDLIVRCQMRQYGWFSKIRSQFFMLRTEWLFSWLVYTNAFILHVCIHISELCYISPDCHPRLPYSVREVPQKILFTIFIWVYLTCGLFYFKDLLTVVIPQIGMRRFCWQKNWKNRLAKAKSKMLKK